MKYAVLFIKLFASCGLLYVLFERITILQAKDLLLSEDGMLAILAAAAIITVQSLLAGWRTSLTMRMFNTVCSPLTGFQVWLIGLFFSQVLVTFIAGDALRVVALKRLGADTRNAALAVLFDRAIGGITLIMLYLAVFPLLLEITPNMFMRQGLGYLAVVGIGVIAVFLVMGKVNFFENAMSRISIITDMISVSKHLWYDWRITAKIVAISAAIHGCSALAIYCAMVLLGLPVQLLWCFVLVQPIMLISLMPISFAGWGLRESIMITGFGLLGLAADKVLAVSVAFGIGLLFAGLPGLILFMVMKKRRSIVLQPVEFQKDVIAQ